MKKFFILILLFIVSINVYSNNIEELEDSAKNCFMQSKYVESLQLYDSIINLGYSSSDLFYNIGNCYYRINDVPNSIYYYEKALILNPSNEDAEFNLKIANQQLKQNIEPVPIPFYKKWEAKVINIMSSDCWTIFNIIMLVLLLAGIAMYLFFNSIALQKTGFAIAVICLVLFVFSAIFAYKSSKVITDNGYAIVFEQSMVKSSPNADAVNSFEICEGTKVYVGDSVNSMYSVKLADGKEGWINASNIKLLSE